MGEDGNELPNEIVGSHDSQPASSGGFDSYRSVSDPNLMIIVAKEVVPPFRFKAGGWELFSTVDRTRFGDESPHC